MNDCRTGEHLTHATSASGDQIPVTAIVIGRNEGERLIRCLASIRDEATSIVYVDSGSTDGSIAAAQAVGAKVVMLDLSLPFTAARARNAGLAATNSDAATNYVQFIDGDCEIRPGWINAGRTFLNANHNAAVVSGRVRERFPEASIYNRLCDREWDTPTGKVMSCGGIAMMRRGALDQVGGFNSKLIAGEEPELCVRLREKGWEIWRLDAEMTLHDAAMTRFSQWWKRVRRGGHAAAEGMAMHGADPGRHGVAQVRRAIVWGLALPLLTISGTLLFTPWSLVLFFAYPAQTVRLAMRKGGDRGDWEEALFLTLGKFPETLGIFEYWARRLVRRPAGLIEYK
ncbi:MAG: glycosyl transferase [Ahrensia sp.]|nr:glycosyl transferase [Ahrensia sp.]